MPDELYEAIVLLLSDELGITKRESYRIPGIEVPIPERKAVGENIQRIADALERIADCLENQD